MTPIVVLRSLAGMALAAVRRLQKPPASDRTPSLTIGALVMNAETPKTPAEPDFPTSRRSEAYRTLLSISVDLLTARFALTRALDKLTTHDLMEVLDEVDETIQGPPQRWRHLSVTPRDENR